MVTEQIDLLRDLAPDDAAAVLALSTRLNLPSGAVLFSLGAEAVDLFVVEQGRIDLTLPMHIGERQEDVLVEERLPGQLVGWSALIPPHRFTLGARAPLESRLLVFPRAALLDLFSGRPDIGYVVNRNLGIVIGHRLQVLQAMWVREMQRVVKYRLA